MYISDPKKMKMGTVVSCISKYAGSGNSQTID